MVELYCPLSRENLPFYGQRVKEEGQRWRKGKREGKRWGEKDKEREGEAEEEGEGKEKGKVLF